MTLPYTYRIKHKTSGTWYYGVRYANGCNPEDLGKKYFSSSKSVKKLIEQYGISDFIFEIRKIFQSAEKAKSWEHKVLSKIINWPNVLNKSYLRAVSDESLKKSHQTKSKIDINGLTGYQRSGLKWKEKQDTIDNVTKLTYREVRRIKYNNTLDKNGTRFLNKNSCFTSENNPTKNPEIMEKIKNSLREYYSKNENHFKNKKHSEKSIQIMKDKKIGENNPCYNTHWITNGKKNKRVKDIENIPDGWYIGRTFKNKMKRISYVCPICGKEGKGPNMKRYHFENCKLNFRF